jgi:hypothetical protein
MIKMKMIKPIIMILLIVASISLLSGCVENFTVFTEGWESKNTEGTTVRLWGRLAIAQAPDNWKEGFVWDTESHDDINLYANKEWASGYSGLNTFYLDVENLDRTQTYHYRAFAEFQGTSSKVFNGINRQFLPGRPIVISKWATDVEQTSAVLEGNLEFMGGAVTCEVFFIYGDDPDALLEETTHQTMTSTGDFNASLTGLTKCETIYYKAIAINDVDTNDGLVLTVTPGQASVETYSPDNVGVDNADLKGKLWHLGGAEECDVWFIYSDTSAEELDESSDHQTMTTTGDFTINIDNLAPDTTYWYRAVADNEECDYAYGDIKQFTTG